MATLEELVKRRIIHRVRVALPRGCYDDREFYAFPEVMEWLNGPVKSEPAFEPTNVSPAHQAYALLRQFNSGQPLNAGRQFKLMRPAERDVFEFVTPDLRFFGWFPRKDKFIAVAGDFMMRTHGHDLYTGYRDKVVYERDALQLDEPKWTPGATEHDVVSF